MMFTFGSRREVPYPVLHARTHASLARRWCLLRTPGVFSLNSSMPVYKYQLRTAIVGGWGGDFLGTNIVQAFGCGEHHTRPRLR